MKFWKNKIPFRFQVGIAKHTLDSWPFHNIKVLVFLPNLEGLLRFLKVFRKILLSNTTGALSILSSIPFTWYISSLIPKPLTADMGNTFSPSGSNVS